MPRLPAPEEYAHATPRSTRQVVPIEHSRVGEAWSQAGRGVSRLGQDLDTLAEEETKKLDALAADNALTKLEDERMRRTFDPKDGFTRIQGTAILDKNNPILKTVPESFNKSIEAIAGTLTPQQQQLFRAKASRVSASLRGDLYRHVAVQTEKAYDESDTARLKQAASVVGVDPSRLDQKVGEVSELLSNRFSRVGETDAAIQNVARTEAIMPLINAALKSYTAGDSPNFEAARQVMKTYDDIIPEAAKKALNEEIKKEERNTVATELSRDMYAAYASGNATITQAEEILSRYGEQDKELKEASRRMFYERVQALNVQRDEGLGGLNQKFLTSPTSKAKQEIMRSEEFKALDGKRQAAFMNFADGEIRQALSWRREDIRWGESRQEKAEADKEKKWFNNPDAIAKYAELVNDPDLGSRQIGYGMAFAPQLGKTLAGNIEQERARQAAGAKKAAYDTALLNDAIPPELLKPAKRDALNAFKAFAHSELLAWKAENPGKIPDEATQLNLLRNSLKEYTLDVPWGFDKERKAYELAPVPTDFVRAVTQKLNRKPTRRELLDAWAVQPDAYKK